MTCRSKTSSSKKKGKTKAVSKPKKPDYEDAAIQMQNKAKAVSEEETAARAIEMRDVPKNAFESLRITLMNFDLEILATQNDININNARLERYKGSNNKKYKQKYFSAIVLSRKLDTYLEKLIVGKNYAWRRLDVLLKLYEPKEKKIWLHYFISQYSNDEIAKKTKLDIETIESIIDKFNKDIIDYNNNQ